LKRGITYRIILTLAIILSAAAFLTYPEQAAETVRESLSVCAFTIIPSLFPLMCVSVFMVESGIAADAGRIFSPIMRPLFNLPGESAPAFILGLIGGYPVGAKTAITLYERRVLNREQTERLLSFCNNSGPAFILGTVGAGVFNNAKIGLMLYFAHILSSITVGVVFRGHGQKKAGGLLPREAPPAQKPAGLSQALSRSIVSSMQSMLNICAFVVFFSAATRMLFLAGIIPSIAAFISQISTISLSEAQGLITGILEVASGVLSLRGAASSMPAALSMAAFMLGWAGVSVHFQVISFIGQKKLSIFPYLVGKFSHGLLSAIYTGLLSLAFPLEMEVAYYLAETVSDSTRMGLLLALLSSLIFSSVVLISGALLSMLGEKR
jgi:sporulation integral membrane protein YlbJ